MSGWISVKDKMPNVEWGEFLVYYHPSYTDPGRISVGVWLWQNKCFFEKDDELDYDGLNYVTHWMPLPEKPHDHEEIKNYLNLIQQLAYDQVEKCLCGNVKVESPVCNCGDSLEICPPNEPFSPGHWICPSCDSTYTL